MSTNLDCKKPCGKCCTIYGTSIRNLNLNSLAQVQQLISDAIELYTEPVIAPRIQPINFFTAAARKLVLDAFVLAEDISPKCCRGFALLIERATQGIIYLTVSNALLPGIPIGTPNDPPGTPTVWGNIRVALGQITAIIETARQIADCEEKKCGTGRKCGEKDNCKCGEKDSCKCCNIFAIALGDLILDSSTQVKDLIYDAIALYGQAEIIPRLAVIQFFYLEASAKAREAFIKTKKVSSKCCEGYAALVSGGLQGISYLTIANALIPGIPIGLPTDPPGTPTVWGNIKVALIQIDEVIAAARLIAKCKGKRGCNKPKENCKCCNIFGTTLGEIYINSTREVKNIIYNAIALYGRENVLPRLGAVQSFYIGASTLARNSFVNQDVSSQCCLGYARAISGTSQAIALYTISNALLPDIPLGAQNDPPGTPTVWGSINAALIELQQSIQLITEIETC